MTFHDWIFSIYPPNSKIDGAWGALHIITMLLCAGIVVGITFLCKKKKEWARPILFIMGAVLLAFELTRRIIGLTRGDVDMTTNYVLRTLFPRPWCAISCWVAMAAVIVNKKFFYNLAASTGILCATVFFAYPTVGFCRTVILFEDLYSICTHSLFLIMCILFVTLGFTDFRYQRGEGWTKTALTELIGLGGIYIYGFIEMALMKIEKDPLYFMPNGEIQEIVGLSHPVYLVLYILFLIFYFNLYYIIRKHTDKKKASITE